MASVVVSPSELTGERISGFRDWLRLLEQTWAAPVLLLPLCGLLFFHGLNAGDLYGAEGLRACAPTPKRLNRG